MRGKHRDSRSLLDLFRKDCVVAGIHPKDEPERRLDVHSLRVTYLTNLVHNAPGMDIKTLQDLARHKDIATTLKHYVRAREESKSKALEGMSLDRLTGSE